MSYILEALRKVERQRRTRAIPDLGTVHGQSPPPQVRGWMPVVLAALIINAGLLALLLWFRPWAPSVPPPAIEAKAPAGDVATGPPSAPPGPPAAPARPAAEPSVSPSGVPPTGAAAPSSAVVPPPSPGSPSGPGTSAAVSAPEPTPVPEVRAGGPDLPAHLGSSGRGAEPAPPPASRRGQDTEAERPTVPPEPRVSPSPPDTARAPRGSARAPADLPPAFREAVARLRLEALVFADSPRDRKVFINGRRYMEGEKLEDGILVERIVEEGVVLSHSGHRYVLRHFR